MTNEELVLALLSALALGGVLAGIGYAARNWARAPRKESGSGAEVLLNLVVVAGVIGAAGYAIHEGKETWQGAACWLGGFTVFWLGISYLSLDKEGARLAQAWRRYAAKHGDRVDAPRRFAFLSLLNGTEAAREVMHAKMKGVRHGVEFEADITSHSPEEISERGTSFRASPAWIPVDGGVTLTHGYLPELKGGSSPPPALERHGAYVFAEPAALASVFQTEEGDRALLEFSKRLPPGLEITAFRRGQARALAMIVTLGWCDEEKELDDTIEVLTRICALSPPADTVSRLERS